MHQGRQRKTGRMRSGNRWSALLHTTHLPWRPQNEFRLCFCSLPILSWPKPITEMLVSSPAGHSWGLGWGLSQGHWNRDTFQSPTACSTATLCSFFASASWEGTKSSYFISAQKGELRWHGGGVARSLQKVEAREGRGGTWKMVATSDHDNPMDESLYKETLEPTYSWDRQG